MLRITPSTSPAGAASYYSTADYYTEGQELTGRWGGKAAAMLGLHGDITPEAWEALCHGKHPLTGEPLKARQKQNTIVGYDFNFHVPKSVSLLHALTRDERILDTFQQAVRTTMHDMETEMLTRVRQGGRNSERTTGNMLFGEFIHTTSRPVDGVPDPHLHAHCFVFSTTWDQAEQQWKAGQFRELKRDAPYFQAAFHARLAKGLQELGLGIARQGKTWEVSGLSKPLLQKFSRRSALIEAVAEQQGIVDQDAKAELGAKTREKKQKQLGMGALRQLWLDRLAPEDRKELLQANAYAEPQPAIELAEEIWKQSIGHCFERRSVVSERELLADVLRRGVGSLLPESASVKPSPDILIFEKNGRRYATTPTIIEEERRLLDFARTGRGACLPLATSTWEWKRDWLNQDQRQAVHHLLRSPDQVMIVRGVAGSGKTALMQEAVDAMQHAGKQVFTFAPSADSSRGVLRSEGFHNATTVAELLVNKQLQAALQGQVIWVDEAGLLGTRTMAQVFDLAKRFDCRVILSGDKRQHSSVERGDALRLLEQEAGLIHAEIREVKRQQGVYRDAVVAMSEGRTTEGFDMLDRLGWVHELPDGEREAAIAQDFVNTLQNKQTALVVSPTHAEGNKVTAAIRSLLMNKKWLGSTAETIPILVNRQLTEGERRDAASYQPADVLVFHQNAKGYQRGQRLPAASQSDLPTQLAERFQVYEERQLSVAPGELLRITRNGYTKDKKHRLNNGAVYRLKKLNQQGDLVLSNGWVVPRDYGFLAHGYVVTSFAAQGKTVDRVLIAESSASLPAASREQAYVSVSRGKHSATIFTDCKETLRDSIERSSERMTASELLKSAPARDHVMHLRRAAISAGMFMDHPPSRPTRSMAYE